jgi:hypothetical protein
MIKIDILDYVILATQQLDAVEKYVNTLLNY